MLSSLLAKEHYDSVTLYTNNIQKQFFVDMGFVYEYDTDILNEVDMEPWTIPKLLSCLSQNEPFIHIDLDTLLLKRINLEKYNSSYVFAHPDITDDDVTIPNDIESLFNNWNLSDFYKTYLYYFYKFRLHEIQLENKIPISLCKIKQIPNMSVIAVKDNLDNFKTALQKTIDLYKILQNEFEKPNNQMSGGFLEQLCFTLYLKNEIGNIDFDFLTTISKIRNVKLLQKKVFNSQSNTLQFYHIGGANRNNPNLISMVIDKIINDFGIEYITKIFDYYKKRVRETGNLITLTDGEKSYEKNNTSNIFTKRIKGLI